MWVTIIIPFNWNQVNYWLRAYEDLSSDMATSGLIPRRETGRECLVNTRRSHQTRVLDHPGLKQKTCPWPSAQAGWRFSEWRRGGSLQRRVRLVRQPALPVARLEKEKWQNNNMNELYINPSNWWLWTLTPQLIYNKWDKPLKLGRRDCKNISRADDWGAPSCSSRSSYMDLQWKMVVNYLIKNLNAGITNFEPTGGSGS